MWTIHSTQSSQKKFFFAYSRIFHGCGNIELVQHIMEYFANCEIKIQNYFYFNTMVPKKMF